ncbi:MAG: YbjN domain-containing protein [Desulfobacteraceae bacterium]|nr:YbjN domain-containing protein [Desulfobacteraceae bacterium]
MNQTTYHFIKRVINEMELEITGQGATPGSWVVRDGLKGIKDMQIQCLPSRVILEQKIMETPDNGPGCYGELLKINRQLEQGAFVLDRTGTEIFFRDTLEIDNLDKNELAASLNGVSLALMEFGDRLMEMQMPHYYSSGHMN